MSQPTHDSKQDTNSLKIPNFTFIKTFGAAGDQSERGEQIRQGVGKVKNLKSARGQKHKEATAGRLDTRDKDDLEQRDGTTTKYTQREDAMRHR